MPDTNIGNTATSDLTNVMTDYSVASEVTDGAGEEQETRYHNTHWSEDYGYYKNIPEFKVAVDTKATWTMGAGYEVDDGPTELILTSITGNGKDNFNSILKNMIKVKTITGDSFAEIILNDNGLIINLKPLDPSSMVIVQDNKGRIKRYEQVTKVGEKTYINKFKPEEIFHLSHERMADEIKGTRIIDSLKSLILARNEAIADWKTVLHRNVRPMRIWYLDTDDEAQIASFKAKTDSAYGNTENIYVPKGTVESEIASVAPNQTLSPLAWVAQLGDMFFQAVNVPQIIIGNAKEFTDASGKIVYLAYEQSVKAEQLYIEEQVLGQLNLEIALTFPASLQNELISSREADPGMQASQPNDTNVEMEGKK